MKRLGFELRLGVFAAVSIAVAERQHAARRRTAAMEPSAAARNGAHPTR
jgi:hypothetical protein